jgi:hypothetical protein
VIFEEDDLLVNSRDLLLYILLLLVVLSTLYVLLTRYNQLLPTLPARQIDIVTSTTRLLPFNDSFLNIVLSLRLFEFIVFSLLVALFHLDYMGRVVRFIVVLLVAILVITPVIYDVFTGNPFHVIPNSMNDYLELLVLSISSILLLAVTVSSLIHGIIIRYDHALYASIILVILILSVCLAGSSVFIDYILVYIAVYHSIILLVSVVEKT